MKKKSKVPYVLVWIGIVLAALSVLQSFVSYFLADSIEADAFANLGIDVSALLLINFISSILGIILLIGALIYVFRMKKKETRKDYVIVTVLGAIGLVFGSFGLGGIVLLVGSIWGIVIFNK